MLETDDPSRRIIRLTDNPSKYKHKTNFPDELSECPGTELCWRQKSKWRQNCK